MEPRELIVSPFNSCWMPWVLMILLIGWVMAYASNPTAFVSSFQGVISTMERRYSDASRSWGLLIGGFILRMLTLSLCVYAYLYLFNLSQDAAWNLIQYLAVCGIFMGVYALKNALIWGLNRIFGWVHNIETIFQQYRNLLTVLSLVAFPVLLLVINFAANSWMRIAFLAIAGFYVLSALVKMCRIFLSKPLSLLYITIYWITLELLPLAGIVLLSYVALS